MKCGGKKCCPRGVRFVQSGVLLLAVGCSSVRSPAGASGAALINGASPLEWSARLADAQISREGRGLQWKEGGSKKWDYAAGLFALSLLKLNEKRPNPQHVEFATAMMDSFVTPDGQIRTYTPEDYNIDNLNPGKTLFALGDISKKASYRKALETLRQQLRDHPRTREGGFWHKKRYPSQMWLDGLYMGAPFYAEYLHRYGPREDFDDVVRQFRIMHRHAYDPRTGLHFHGWDEEKQQPWADPATGTSSNFWGRGLGWFSMALVDVLDFLPADHPGRQELILLLNVTCEGVVKHQDKETGLWWQVLDQGGREGNYLEATAAAMFVYALAKGVNKGYLKRSFSASALTGYRGILEKHIRMEADGKVALMSCCQVAGLGYGRDGSYAYYLREPVVENDLKGVGPFILAGIEIQALMDQAH